MCGASGGGGGGASGGGGGGEHVSVESQLARVTLHDDMQGK